LESAGKNGDECELTVIRFQFSNSARDDWDANWLIAELSKLPSRAPLPNFSKAVSPTTNDQ
jgi:hypothetical protein